MSRMGPKAVPLKENLHAAISSKPLQGGGLEPTIAARNRGEPILRRASPQAHRRSSRPSEILPPIRDVSSLDRLSILYAAPGAVSLTG
jgi:hypothetical protein